MVTVFFSFFLSCDRKLIRYTTLDSPTSLKLGTDFLHFFFSGNIYAFQGKKMLSSSCLKISA